MELIDLVNLFNDNVEKNTIESKAKCLVIAKIISDYLDEKTKPFKKELENLEEETSWNFSELERKISMIIKKSSEIDSCAINELSDEEIRKTYKLTESNLKSLNRKDLIDKYKRITEVHSVVINKSKD